MQVQWQQRLFLQGQAFPAAAPAAPSTEPQLRVRCACHPTHPCLSIWHGRGGCLAFPDMSLS